MLGVALMRVAAQMFIRLLEKFPRFETSAYLLVIVIGLKLLADWGVNSDWSFRNSPWVSRQLGTAKHTFEGIEARRRDSIEGYEGWLDRNWIFPPSKWETKEHLAPAHAPHGDDAPLPPIDEAEKPPVAGDAVDDSLHTPHLLNFHQLTRPESIVFWVAMLVCFMIGFIPKTKHRAPLPLGERSE